MGPEKIKVLLVDDEVDFTRNVSRVLIRRGFEVDTAEDGLLALAMTARRHYDVVVLDFKMPGMNGIQVLTEIKRVDPSVQVILLTGHFSVTDEERTLENGAYAYLLKPFPIIKLVDLITAAASCDGKAQADHSFCPF
ncbi:MAG: response regulator [Desulfobacteraceae bacterium]|nr:response regulator [Desulfobacteraceae bacterium]